jgi:fructuronate reductase
MRVSNAALPSLRADVARPRYDRATVTPGIVHLGIGAFHRAHQAVYLDDCLAAGETGWGIVAASLRSAETRNALAPQDGLYTLWVRDSDSEALRIVGSIGEVLVAPEDPALLLARLTDPRIRIVTLTVTEKGYTVDLGTGRLLADHRDIVHDIAHPAEPRSALGFLAEAIERRRRAGVAPFTLLSCDNLPHNGRTLAMVLGEFARLRSQDLASYIEGEVACPSSMVDRIVPGTTDADRTALAERLGMSDGWPVLTEPFTQWVIEDRFPSGRPDLASHGVEFVRDVEPFEHMKLRLLNGSHTALAAVGRLIGVETVADAIEHPAIRPFIEAYWKAVIPTLSIPPADAHAYTRRLLQRFGNRALRHRTAQIASDASQKIPQRIIAPLRELTAAGRPADVLVFAVAAWIRSCDYDAAGGIPALNDPAFEAWTARPDQRSLGPAKTVRAFMTYGPVFGTELPANERFVSALTAALEAIDRKGALAALGDVLS